MLEVNQLGYAYEEAGHARCVFSDVSFSISEGERVALLGSSGSGKSTLLNVVGGIDRPETGAVSIASTTLTSLAEPALTQFRCQHMGYIYQQFNLIPTLSVAENVQLPLELLGYSASDIGERCQRWLDAVGLGDRGSAFPDRLSGGEQQRVAIARAMVHEPALLLADEPTGNLDAETGLRILDLIFQLAARQQQSLLVVTHSRAVAQRADRILVLSEGRLAEGDQALAW